MFPLGTSAAVFEPHVIISEWAQRKAEMNKPNFCKGISLKVHILKKSAHLQLTVSVLCKAFNNLGEGVEREEMVRSLNKEILKNTIGIIRGPRFKYF